MEKKIGDLTLKEKTNYCNEFKKYFSCYDCKLHSICINFHNSDFPITDELEKLIDLDDELKQIMSKKAITKDNFCLTPKQYKFCVNHLDINDVSLYTYAEIGKAIEDKIEYFKQNKKSSYRHNRTTTIDEDKLDVYGGFVDYGYFND